MSYFVTNHQSEEQRRDELIRIIEHSVERLTLQELEALYCDMSTKNYINESPIASWEEIRGRFFDPKATLRAEDRRRTPRELKWME